MVENGPATTPSAEQIDEWVKTFPAYTTKKMKTMVVSRRAMVKAELGLAKAPEQTKLAHDANRAVHLW